MISKIQMGSKKQEKLLIWKEFFLQATDDGLLPVEERPVLSLEDFLEQVELEERQIKSKDF